MSEKEVTQAQYTALMGTNPSYWSGANNPVELVTWSNARAYCAALTAQQIALDSVPPGYQYRLPTEAEWEYACRAGTTTEFNVGAALFCDQANFSFSYHSNSSCSPTPQGTVPVGSYTPNAWGLYDMIGNVWEWTLDWYQSKHASAGSCCGNLNPKGGREDQSYDPCQPESQIPRKVLKGGSHLCAPNYCRRYRPAARFPEPIDTSTCHLGFRCVVRPSPQS
jgi:formylglycine-generating enzyme required for sulfatase activity